MDIEAMEQQLAERDAEIAELRRRLAGPETTRRNLLKGGAAAGGLAALGAVALATASSAGATVGPDVPYPGASSAALALTANGVVIEGDVTRKGFENAIEVHYFQHLLSVELKPTGQSTGRRTHGPVVFRKHTDKSTPLIIKALVNNEAITADFHFLRLDPNSGQEVDFFRVEVEGARIVSVNEYSPDNESSSGQTPGARRMEEVGIAFNTIRWIYVDGNIQFEDTWNAIR
jgi:type VI secretion system secreted protein Hcp